MKDIISISKSGKVDAQRAVELGTDPGRGYVPHEAWFGPNIEKRYGAFMRDPSKQAEWISKSGPYKRRTYELTGLPFDTSKFRPNIAQSFLPKFDRHLRKSVDYRSRHF